MFSCLSILIFETLLCTKNSGGGVHNYICQEEIELGNALEHPEDVKSVYKYSFFFFGLQLIMEDLLFLVCK